jgi:hypothetical protein
MDKTVVGLNVATRSCNVYPAKCWFGVLCRFWLQCSRTLTDDGDGDGDDISKRVAKVTHKKLVHFSSDVFF